MQDVQRQTNFVREAANQEARNMMAREMANWSAELETFRKALEVSKQHQTELENELREVQSAYNSNLTQLTAAGLSPQLARDGGKVITAML